LSANQNLILADKRWMLGKALSTKKKIVNYVKDTKCNQYMDILIKLNKNSVFIKRKRKINFYCFWWESNWVQLYTLCDK
jgi:hypothetical protein